MRLIIFLCLILNVAGAKAEWTDQSAYKKPEDMISQLVNAGSFPRRILNRQKTAFIKAYYEELPSIAYVARPQFKMGGVRFNPINYTAINNFYIKQLRYFDMKTKKESPIAIVKDSVIREVNWAPDGKNVVISVETEKCQELWLLQIPSLQKSRIPGVCLNAVLGRTVTWKNSRELLIGARTPLQSLPLKQEKETPTGPVILESKGAVAQNRTYPDLLKTPQDARIFAAAAKTQLVLYNIKTKQRRNIGSPEMFKYASLSPNEKYILVSILQEPFSYVVPYYLFASKTEVWEANGKFAYEVAQTGPFENIPIEGTTTGPRNISWVDSEPQTLYYLEALDKGDWKVKADYRDELWMIKVPEKHAKLQPESILKLKNRFQDLDFFEKENMFLVTDFERDRQWLTTQLVQKQEQGWLTKPMFSLSEHDDYNNPGNPYCVRNQYDRIVIAINKGDNAIYFAGAGATPQGEHPFLRKMNLFNFESQELFRSETGTYESFVTFLDHDFAKFLTNYETQKESPRMMLRQVKSADKTLLDFDKNPYEILSKIKKEIITYKRKDGVLLSAVLYYPLNYEAGKKYPAIIQAYPLEYTDASTAGQVRGSQDRFEIPFREAIIYNALRGYVVLDDAQMPIIGHPETKNDTYIEQLVMGAQAAVDTMNERGLIDPKRVGVIGHSYGAFMVANLLTHSDLFATGIAKSGAYNRTLTPNGFQGERRTFWQAKDTYLKMSPFVTVEKMKKPIMLMHGMADNNPGTFTLQSERYFEALKSQGAVARLVLLPEEMHGYASRESIEHVLYEIFAWFDTYLKAPQLQ